MGGMARAVGQAGQAGQAGQVAAPVAARSSAQPSATAHRAIGDRARARARASHWRSALSAAALVLLGGCCAQATARTVGPARRTSLADERRTSSGREAHPDMRSALAGHRIRVGRSELSSARAIPNMTAADCRRVLQDARVRFDTVSTRTAPGIAAPVALRSSVLGVRFEPANGMAKNGIMDCKLAVALLAWAPILRDAGVVRVEHYSTFRPGARVRGTGKVSGHAHALAIDAARFHLADGRVLEVLEDWDERERGGDPCPVRRSEDPGGRILRQVVCRAVERDLFQVVVTPHHDRDHQNHVHLEIVPKIGWSWVR